MVMPPAQGLDCAALAKLVYDSIIAHFHSAGVELPKRRIIAGGVSEAIAWDCEQFVITLPVIGRGTVPGFGANTVLKAGNQFSATSLRYVKIDAQVVRCEPTPAHGDQPPPPEQITKAGLALMRDAGLLSQALVMVGSTITGRIYPGSEVQTGDVQAIGPEGGLVGLQAPIYVTALGLI